MKCKNCATPVPESAGHFSNQFAISNGYCGWLCMLGKEGDESLKKLAAETRRRKNEKMV